MDGIHDLGGKQGFDSLSRPQPEQVYKHDWEMRIHAMSLQLMGRKIWNMDEQRHAIERMQARHYMTASYYERWLTAVATLCVEKGLTTSEALADLAGGGVPLSRPSAPGRPAAAREMAFAVGDAVRVKNEYVAGHTRMPSYLRGKKGVIARVSAICHYPDAAAHGIEEKMQETYEVCFDSAELWPGSADRAEIYATVFSSYLDTVNTMQPFRQN